MATSVEIEIVAQLKKAEQSINKFAKDTEKQLSAIKVGIDLTALNQAIELANRALQPFVGFLKDAVGEALAAEDANVRLANSLRLMGDFSESAVKNFNDLAQSIQKSTTFTDDEVIASAALAKQFSLTNKEVEFAVKAASDLAAVQGIDLKQATQEIAQTYNGFVDKGLGKVIPALKSLTKEQLLAGEGARIIAERVNGSAAALANTFGGALKQVTNQLGEITEEIGKAIVETPEFIAVLRGIKGAVDSLLKSISENRGLISEVFVGALQAVVDAAPGFIAAMKAIDTILSNFAIGASIAAKSIGAFAAAVSSVASGNFSGLKEIKESLFDQIEATQQLNSQRIDKFYGALQKGADAVGASVKSAATHVERFDKNLKQGDSQSGFEKRKQDATSLEEKLKRIEELTKNPFKLIFKTIDQGNKPLINLKQTEKEFAAISSSFATSILKGAQGATDLVTQGIGEFAGLLLGPGFAGPFKEIAGLLAQGPDAVKAQVEAFAKALPEIIKAIIESIPVFIKALIDAIPQIIDAIIESIPELINALVEALPEIAVKLATLMPRVAVQLAASLIENLPRIVTSFIQGLVNAAPEFIKALINALKDFGNIGKGVVGGVADAGGGILDAIGGIFGFAEGGRVPDNPRFKGDRFPARLDQGEQVLSQDLSNKLENFLNGGGGGATNGPTTVNLNVGQRQLAQVILDLNRNDFRTA